MGKPLMVLQRVTKKWTLCPAKASYRQRFHLHSSLTGDIKATGVNKKIGQAAGEEDLTILAAASRFFSVLVVGPATSVLRLSSSFRYNNLYSYRPTYW